MNALRSDPAWVRARLWLALIGLAGLVILAAAPLPQVDADAALYGRIAANVLATGDWITFHYPGWFVDKPPLTFWVMAASFRFLGVSDVALRLWQLLLALALIVLTYRVARAAGATREAGLLAALVLATATQFFYQATVPQQDLPLAFFLTLGMYGVIMYLDRGAARWIPVAAVGAALAVLTSGIAGLGLFGVVLLAVLFIARPMLPHAGRALLGRAALAAAVFAGLALPWFVVGALRQGDQFVATFLTSGTMGVGRFFTPASSTPPPYWLAIFAYVPILLVGMLPWSPVLVSALAGLRRLYRDGPSGMKIVAVWFLAIFALFSLSSGDKVFRYLLSCFPPAAILTGRAAAALLDRPDRLRWVGRGALLPAAALLAAGFWFLWAQFPVERGPWVAVAGSFAAALAAALVAFGLAALRGRGAAAVALAAAGAVAAFIVLEVGMLANAPQIAPWRDLSSAAAPLTARSERLILYGRATEGFNFMQLYLDEPLVRVGGVEQLASFWRRERILVVVPEERIEELTRVLVPSPVLLFVSPARMLLIANWSDAGKASGAAE